MATESENASRQPAANLPAQAIAFGAATLLPLPACRELWVHKLGLVAKPPHLEGQMRLPCPASGDPAVHATMVPSKQPSIDC